VERFFLNFEGAWEIEERSTASVWCLPAPRSVSCINRMGGLTSRSQVRLT